MNVDAATAIQQWIDVLGQSADGGELERAAVNIAEAGDREAVEILGQLLGHRSFLARLDRLDDPAECTFHLARVLRALARHPRPEVGELAVSLANNPEFAELDDRRIDLLPVIAAVRPMTDAGADVIRRAAGEGYASAVIPLLVANGSPRALALFEQLVRQSDRDAESRIADLHAALLPFRTEMLVLESVERLLSSALEEPVRVALLETLFDYRSRDWFGPGRDPPRPPPWQGASTEALRLLGRIGEAAQRQGLPDDLAAPVEGTLAETRAIVSEREAASGSPNGTT